MLVQLGALDPSNLTTQMVLDRNTAQLMGHTAYHHTIDTIPDMEAVMEDMVDHMELAVLEELVTSEEAVVSNTKSLFTYL